MSIRQNDESRHMDRDAYRMFSRGLFLMLSGVLLSVLALLFLPYLTMMGKLALVLGGVAGALGLVFWPAGEAAEAHAGREAVGK